MTIKEWVELKHGDVIKHKDGDVERIYEAFGKKYIEGEKTLFPLSEFESHDWEVIKK